MDYFLGQSGITRFASDLKTKFQALFAAISHTHNAAIDLIGQVPIANGGTGASTQADAQVALDIAPKDSAAHTVGEIETMVSGLTSKTGVDGMTVGEDDLHTQIQTLQDSVTLPAGTYNFPNLVTAGYQSGSGNYLSFNIPYTFASSVANASIINVDLTLFRPNGAVGQFTSSNIDTTYIVFAKYLSYTKIELKFSTTQDKGLPVVVSVNTLQIRFT